MRAALYPRVSTSTQVEEGFSLGEQEERMKAFCEMKGWEVYKVYQEAGFTGKNTDRPALEKLVHDAEQRLFDIVVVYKLDRLSRSQKDTLTLIEDVFIPNNVDFVSITENFDTSTPFGRAMIGLLSVFAQLDRDQIRERLEIGREARIKAGKWTGSGRPPIGYRYIDGMLEVDDYEAMQICELFHLYSMRIPPSGIIQIMNEKGYHTSYGAWQMKPLNPIIKNRIYLGEVSYKGKWYEGEHKAIIDKELFKAAQKVLTERENSHKRKPRFSSPVSQLTTCAHCGSDYFIRTDKHDRYGERLHYYSCPRRCRYGGKWAGIPKEERCGNRSFRVDAIEEKVFESVRELSMHPDTFTIEEKQDDRTERIRTGIFDMNKVKEKAEPLNEEKSALTLELKKLNDCKKISKKEAVQLAIKLDGLLDNGTVDEVRYVLHELIDSIVIDNDKVHIYWNFA